VSKPHILIGWQRTGLDTGDPEIPISRGLIRPILSEPPVKEKKGRGQKFGWGGIVTAEGELVNSNPIPVEPPKKKQKTTSK
jgi:hypothetical protein